MGETRAPGEALWREDDTEAVLEFLREEALRCPGCGLPRDETMSPEAEGFYRSRALRCHACASQERERKRFEGAKDHSSLQFTVERKDNGSG